MGFIGGLNKQVDRNTIFNELRNRLLPSGHYLYIEKFDLPKMKSYFDVYGRLIVNKGYAFITTKTDQGYQELLNIGRLELNGSVIDIRKIDQKKWIKAWEKR